MREMYVPPRSLVGSGLYIHRHALDWIKRWQSNKMLNNAENWLSTWALKGCSFACVVECMDMHGGIHVRNLSGVVFFARLASPTEKCEKSKVMEKQVQRVTKGRDPWLTAIYPFFLTYILQFPLLLHVNSCHTVKYSTASAYYLI